MAKCDVCAEDAMEVYSIDEFGMCWQCLASGRINELPPFKTSTRSGRANANDSAPLTRSHTGAQARRLDA
ncbi:MAG: hypothetical protein DLM53_06105 [Candidatus Eremiobacter antarcticus]|nr:MAG: hypothetical protein DLM53_06105 [Candidatus Eremiobacter sp. RRmetagenome_bin22]